MMTNYEIMFIVKSTLEDGTRKNLVKDIQNLISSNKGKVIEFKEMGRKKLAYPIEKEMSGFYYLMQVAANSDTIKEFDRKVRINENILRHLILKKESE